MILLCVGGGMGGGWVGWEVDETNTENKSHGH